VGSTASRFLVGAALTMSMVGCATIAPPQGSSTSQIAPTHDSLGHEDAEQAIDPSVALSAYGYYASLRTDPVAAAPFTLTDQDGQPFTFDPRGDDASVTLLYFGYTNCPDLCPSELATVAAALRHLPAAIADEVQMVFVSVDPERDDVDRLAEYMPLFDPDFEGLTGNAGTIRRAQVAHGLEPALKIGDGDDYAMRHAAEVLAFTDDGRAHLVFPFGMTVPQWEHDLSTLVEKGWRDFL
jgi:protein SCO1/2